MAEPGQLRLQNNRLFVVLSWWCDDTGSGEGTHWLCALISKRKEPYYDTELKLNNGMVCEAMNFMTLTDHGIETYSTLAGTLEEQDRKSICEIIFSSMGEDIRSPRTREMQGPEMPRTPAQEYLDYRKEDEYQFRLIELADKFWQDFWGLVPKRRYRKYKHKELPRVKARIKHRRWEDDDYDGSRG